MQEAFALADKICLMDQGAVVQIGTPAELIFQPANAFVQRFFAQHQVQLSLPLERLDSDWF